MDQQIDQSTAPNQFLCPIYQQIMKDPVLTVDGFTFQRRAIQEWFAKGKNTNPLTNKPISKNLLQNRALRNVIEHHNQRVRQIQRQAASNAQQFIKTANQSLAQLFPDLINQVGLLDLDKLVQLSTQYSQIRKLLQKLNENFNPIKKLCQQDCKNCNNCKSMVDSLTSYKKIIQGDVSNSLKFGSAFGNGIQVEPDQIYCLIINNDMVKGIDFKRLKKSDLKKFSIKAILLKKITIQQLIIKIRVQKKIDEKDYIRVWVTDLSLDKLYDHISQQAEVITGPYICKVKCVGKKVENLKKKIQQFNLKNDDYFIIEHGPKQEYVFRDSQGKCDYCYRMKPINKQCDCKKVMYCSSECQAKDKPYHDRVCINNPENKGSQRNIKV